jgi:uncharacterized protein YlaN (UPF0358 family)
MSKDQVILEGKKTTDLMAIHNLLYEHRKNVCRLMVIEKMNPVWRNKLYNYTEVLQTRINDLSKSISFKVEIVEPNDVENMTVEEYSKMMKDGGY